MSGCSCERAATTLPDADERDPTTGLTPAEAAEVLVTVGEHPITLGQYAATLLRMDQFERLRYQTEERQKELLDEMIEVELLAQEARRLGLDQDAEVQLHLQQAMRDELLNRLDKRVPGPDSFSEREVRAYYDAHRSEFSEPRRHRVLAIAVDQESLATEILQKVQGESGQIWAELAKKYSTLPVASGAGEAEEMAGDWGFVSQPGQERGQNAELPEALRAAIFEVEKVGEVVPHVVSAGNKHYVLRLGGVSPARERTLSEADRTIRVELRRLLFLEEEKKFEQQLRDKYPVVIDEEKILAYRSGSEDATRQRAAPEAPPP